MSKKVVFITGTRADFGKLRSLLDRMVGLSQFDVHIFVTGMHMLSKYGSTCMEVEKRNYPNIYKYINQNYNDTMDTVLGKTIQGLSDYVKEIQPDMIVVHGDRVEALAGATVGSLNNILVAHIEGGEVSGTVDELIRHAVSKMSHLHFVSNERAKQRLLQLGENDINVYVIGSPDVDVLFSNDLPSLDKVKQWYDIPFDEYGILLFHPVTTEAHDIERQSKVLVDAVVETGKNFVVIYPNNDLGSDYILQQYRRLEKLDRRFRVIPSMRFDYFLTLLKNTELMVGNSSCAVMEAPYYGVPAVDIGSRQNNRAALQSIISVPCQAGAIKNAIRKASSLQPEPTQEFGIGDSAKQFVKILSNPTVWSTAGQKQFNDRAVSQ
ncbi:UDP-N-acetylglucosamine 2-epimerase [Aurantivibrio plasticivorans]